MDMEGMVMHENTDRLPRDCPQITKEEKLTVKVGTKYAHRGTLFGFDQPEWHVEPCAKVTVTLINEDQVRHQWMIHELPRYLYPQGMFHMEVNGGHSKTGTFIVPSAARTYLVHCDLAQHTEKGMKAQLKVGKGNGDLPSVPGLTGPRQLDTYPIQWGWWTSGVALVAGLVGVALAVKGLGRLL
jgi:plastocyanin